MGNIDSESEARFKAKREAILERATPELKQAVIAASEKGASCWVTASPSYDSMCNTIIQHNEGRARQLAREGPARMSAS